MYIKRKKERKKCFIYVGFDHYYVYGNMYVCLFGKQNYYLK